ncbi:UPF0182 family protein [Clostridium senegalense]|uniref:UPF0182 protein G3M99_15740 n=1 Tax=Clostridium senegalense TaxID=1465809 RepID=A0A6M0H6W0_9CLOT|nr:COG1615 family transporter [Clostridium senegalense]
MASKKRIGLYSLILIAVILGAIVSGISIIVDYQWFKEIGYLPIYFKQVVSILKLMIPIFMIIFIAITLYYLSLRPNIRKVKKVIEINRKDEKKKLNKFLFINGIISLIISFIFSFSYWYKILEFKDSTSFNISDPIFNKDISFFIFKLPLIRSLYNMGITLVVMLVIITFIMYISFITKDKIKNKIVKNNIIKDLKSGMTTFAGKQLAVLTALIMIFLAIGYMVKGWDLVYSPRGTVFGTSYTDAKVSLKFYRAISIASIVCSVVVFLSVIRKKFKPIFMSVCLIAILIIGENIASIGVQGFVVQSNEKTLEKPYIEQNIKYTKLGFNIDDIEENNFDVNNSLVGKDIEDSKDIIDNIKINSVKPALEFNNQFQYIRYYYGFKDMDIDRYNINNKYSQVFISARELDLDKLDENSNTWQNRHLAYTHGYGVTMSKVNSVTSEGQPDFVIGNIPIENETDLKLDNPRIYFGESTNDYSIVNTKLGEIDYPMRGENITNNYDGNAGISMNLINRVMFAIKYKNPKFLLSQDITKDSKILINRNIIERAKKIAPFIKYDKDPYIVVEDGKLYWILDGYTVSNKFPFSQPIDGINYIRNSVKVIVDAYDGTTNFYISDSSDPIAQTYAKIFPELFKSIDKVPSNLKSHFKYPEDLFNIQSRVLGKYHVKDAGIFYNGDDVWTISSNKEKIDEEEKERDASYVIMRLPGEEKDEMVVLEYFNTKGRDNMVSMFGVRMDDENYGKMFLYKFPTGGTVYSPMLFQKKIHQDPEISKELSLWDTKGSEVQFGDTIIVPIKDSLLYVEPLYLRAAGEKSIPEMRNVIVGYSDKIVLAPSVDEALVQLFNYEDKNTGKDNNPNLNKNELNEIKDIYNKAIESQKQGEWGKYGDYINDLGEKLDQLLK